MILTTIFSEAFLVGILAHVLVFIRGEWHLNAPAVLLVHLLSSSLIFSWWLHENGVSAEAIVDAASVVLSYLCGLFVSIVVYRLSPRHRLWKFSGPRMAAVSKFWHVWQCRDSRNHLLMDWLHEKYGDFARIGPNEIASFHPDTFKVLDGFGTKCRKSDFYDLLLPDHSLVFTRDKRIHDARKNVWTRALNQNAIAKYRNRIDRQIKVLTEKLSASATANKPVVINQLMYWFAFDSMGEFAFNHDFGMMKRQQWHYAIILFRRALSILGPFTPTIWLIRVGFTFFPWFWRIRDWFSMMRFCDYRMTQRLQTKPKELDIASSFIDEEAKNGESSPTRRWLKGDGATVVVAGSDTMGPSLTFLCYILAKYPDTAAKIQKELENVDPLDLSAIPALPHLNATIHESMRLYPAAPTVGSRNTPSEGIMIGETFIPGDTKVLAPRWIIMRLESCFERAKEFIPERWYSKPEMVKKKYAFSPFGMGRTSCVGQTLAMTQIRLVLASLLKRFNVSFVPGENGETLLRDMRDQLTAQPGRLTLMFQNRE